MDGSSDQPALAAYASPDAPGEQAYDVQGGKSYYLPMPHSQLPGSVPEQQRRKRGRPPKDPQIPAGRVDAVVGEKRPRGRPPGSKNKICKTGPPLVPHVLLVHPGEDVVERLKYISKSYGRSVCILAANGTLSVATLMQIGEEGQGVGVTLKGNFTVLSISGAILQNSQLEIPGQSKAKSREPTVFLSASLANPRGGVVGGTVAGTLEASGLVTLVIGHWEPDRAKGEGSDLDTAGVSQYGTPESALPATSPLHHAPTSLAQMHLHHQQQRHNLKQTPAVGGPGLVPAALGDAQAATISAQPYTHHAQHDNMSLYKDESGGVVYKPQDGNSAEAAAMMHGDPNDTSTWIVSPQQQSGVADNNQENMGTIQSEQLELMEHPTIADAGLTNMEGTAALPGVLHTPSDGGEGELQDQEGYEQGTATETAVDMGDYTG